MAYDPLSDDTQVIDRDEWNALVASVSGLCPACSGTGVDHKIPTLTPGLDNTCKVCDGEGFANEMPLASRLREPTTQRLLPYPQANLDLPPDQNELSTDHGGGRGVGQGGHAASVRAAKVAEVGWEEPADPVEYPFFLSDEEIAQSDREANWSPSLDQQQALQVLMDAIRKPGAYVVDGPAGSGKTTIFKALLRRLSPHWDVSAMALSWAAANRVTEVTGLRATSIHRKIYGAPVTERQCPCGEWAKDLMKPVPTPHVLDEDGKPIPIETPQEGSFELPRYVCPTCHTLYEDATRFPQRLDFELPQDGGEAHSKPYRLIMVDEVGMAPRRVRRDIQRALGDDKTRLIGFGDKNQNPAVEEETPEPVEEEPYLSLDHPVATLTSVHRQGAGSPVLGYATTLYTHPVVSDVAWPFPFRLPGIHIQSRVPLDVPARWAADLRQRGENHALIALANKTRALLNVTVRQFTGAAHYGALIPGDRLLARANTQPLEVFNGELFDLCDLTYLQSSLLDESGRMRRKRPSYEHDRILEGGVVPIQVTLARVGDPQHARFDALMACPRGAEGWPVLESHLILGGTNPQDAKQRTREVSRAWREEYVAGIEERKPEYEMHRQQAETKKVLGERFRRAGSVREQMNILKAIRRLDVLPALVEETEREATTGALSGAENRVAAFERFSTNHDIALDCESALDYCQRVYGAVDPAQVCTFDLGEAVTGHSMQGNQAQWVGVVFDGAFWGMWKNDRKAALQWAYTAATRSTEHLALFSIRREG